MTEKTSYELSEFEWQWLYCTPGPFHELAPGDEVLPDYLADAEKCLKRWQQEELKRVREFGPRQQPRTLSSVEGVVHRSIRGRSKLADDLYEAWYESENDSFPTAFWHYIHGIGAFKHAPDDVLKIHGILQAHEDPDDPHFVLLCLRKWSDVRFRRLYRWMVNPRGVLNFVCEGFQAGLRIWCHRVSTVPVKCLQRSDFAALDELAELVLTNCRSPFMPEGPSSLLGRDDLSIVRWMFPLMTDSAIPEVLLTFTEDSDTGNPDDGMTKIFQRVLELQDDIGYVDELSGQGDDQFPRVSADRECRVIGLRMVNRAMEEAARFGRVLFDKAPEIDNEHEALDIIRRITDDCLANLPENAVPTEAKPARIEVTSDVPLDQPPQYSVARCKSEWLEIQMKKMTTDQWNEFLRNNQPPKGNRIQKAINAARSYQFLRSLCEEQGFDCPEFRDHKTSGNK